MNIVLTFDNSYTQHAAALIASICVNCSTPVCFFIISDFISSENKKHIEDLIYKYGQDVCFKFFDKTEIKKFPIGAGTANEYVTLATYYRLVIADILPQNIKKVIYLDCDIIVNQDLSDLWNIDMSNVCVAALEEQEKLSINAARRLNYSQKYSYFNAGVLLLNLEKIREQFSFCDFVSYINEKQDKIMFHDQDVLNSFFHDSKMFLPLKYNVMDCFMLKNASIPRRYKQEAKSIMSPSIIHYSGPLKPWHIECKNPYKYLYYKYLNLTFWSHYQAKKKYINPKDMAIYKLKTMVKVILEICHIRYYSYIKLQ